MLENNSVLGPFFMPSFLPVSGRLVAEERMDNIYNKVTAELEHARSQAQFEKMAQNLNERQKGYTKSLANLLKTLLKTKSHRESVMRWLAASIVSNFNRSKLGHNLMHNTMQGKIMLISSDAFCLNALYVMYELCIPFLNLQDEKLKKIDPTYLPHGGRIDLTDETPICTDKEQKKALKFQKEYGTISEFYFMLSMSINYGLLHMFHKCEDI